MFNKKIYVGLNIIAYSSRGTVLYTHVFIYVIHSLSSFKIG